jgi:hypothetical protein
MEHRLLGRMHGRLTENCTISPNKGSAKLRDGVVSVSSTAGQEDIMLTPTWSARLTSSLTVDLSVDPAVSWDWSCSSVDSFSCFIADEIDKT